MSDLTLEEKTNYAQRRAAEKEAELHFFDAAQPFFPLGFSVYYRNPGHWDVSAKQCPGKISAWLKANPGGSTSGRDGESERAFRIRGEPGNVVVYDERWNPHRRAKADLANQLQGALRPAVLEPIPTFKSVMGAMLWIMEELMQEPKRSSATPAGEE